MYVVFRKINKVSVGYFYIYWLKKIMTRSVIMETMINVNHGELTGMAVMKSHLILPF